MEKLKHDSATSKNIIFALKRFLFIMPRSANGQKPTTNSLFSKFPWLPVAMALIIAVSSCASSNHHTHKKLKRGKPIPCPLKDC
jgi:hypothetical protein